MRYLLKGQTGPITPGSYGAISAHTNKRAAPEETARLLSGISYEWGRNLRRTTPAKPRMPVPSKAKVEGSGVIAVPSISIA
jgi:hypothetical protein